MKMSGCPKQRIMMKHILGSDQEPQSYLQAPQVIPMWVVRGPQGVKHCAGCCQEVHHEPPRILTGMEAR